MFVISKSIENSEVNFVQIKKFESFDIEEVLTLFQAYKDRGIIINDSFYDSTWRLDNSVVATKINFNINEVLFMKESKERNIGDLNNLINAIKAIILYKLDEFVIRTLNEFVKNLISLLNETRFFRKDGLEFLKKPPKQTIKSFNMIIEFISFYNVLNVDESYIELIEFHWDNYVRSQLGENNQRDIGQFESVFKLNEVIDQFWVNANSELKEKYYPIMLWWKITMTIPLRTTELTVTPYDCLRIHDNNYYLTVRRTSLKGPKGNKRVNHDIDGDYKLQELRITKELYDLIDDYKRCVDHYDTKSNFYGSFEIKEYKRNLLFSYRSYYNARGNPGTNQRVINLIKQYGNERFGSRHLYRLLDNFFVEIVSGQFHYEIVTKLEKEELKENQIEFLRPMDTRHHAFINMILNDIEPLFVKKIGGHDHIESSIHYFSHVDKFVKCFTYSTAKRLLKSEKVINKSGEIEFYSHFNKSLLEQKSLKYREVEYGLCSSLQSLSELPDCKRVNNNCLICKPYFHPKNTQILIDQIKRNEERISTETESLKKLIETFKTAKNFKEEYMQKVNIIKGYANQNANLISQVITEEA